MAEPAPAEPTLEQRVFEFLDKEPEPDGPAPNRRTSDGGIEPVPQEPEKPEAKTEAPAEPEAETPEAEEPESPAEPEADPGDGEDEGIRTFGEIAKHFDVPESDLANAITVEVGEESLSISDLVSAHQNAEGRIRDAATRTQAETEALQRDLRAKSDEKLQDLFAATEQLVRHIESEPKMTPEQWAELKAQDPTAYTLKREEMRERQEVLDASFQRLHKEAAERKEQEDQDYKKWLDEQSEQLIAKKPEWADEAKANEAVEKVKAYLKSYGFADGEFQQLADHRLLLVAWEASEYRRLMTKKPGKDKIVKDAPKILPARARRPPARKGEQLDRNMKALYESGSDADARAAMEELVELTEG